MSKEYTLAEIAQHTSSESCWIAIHGKVYDISAFLNEHPGGAEIILEECREGGRNGRDATDMFELVGHSKDARKMLERFLKGTVRSIERPAREIQVEPQLVSPGLWRSLKWVPPFFKFGMVYVLSQATLHKLVSPSPGTDYRHYLQRMHSVSQYAVSSCHCLSSAASGLKVLEEIKNLKLICSLDREDTKALQISSTLGEQLHVEAGYYVFDTIADGFGLKLRSAPIQSRMKII